MEYAALGRKEILRCARPRRPDGHAKRSELVTAGQTLPDPTDTDTKRLEDSNSQGQKEQWWLPGARGGDNGQ